MQLQHFNILNHFEKYLVFDRLGNKMGLTIKIIEILKFWNFTFKKLKAVKGPTSVFRPSNQFYLMIL